MARENAYREEVGRSVFTTSAMLADKRDISGFGEIVADRLARDIRLVMSA